MACIKIATWMLSLITPYTRKFDKCRVMNGVLSMVCMAVFLSSLGTFQHVYAGEWRPGTERALTDPSWQIIDDIWRFQKPLLAREIQASLSQRNTQVLYDIQGFTNVLLEYAASSGKRGLVNELSELYATALGHLKLEKTYVYYYFPGHPRKSTHPLEPRAMMWAGPDGEVVLCVSQFLYLVSRAVNVILDIPEDERTENMNALIVRYAPVLRSHYDRWVFGNPGVFQVTGWGGDEGLFNHSQFVKKRLNREFKGPKYCNAITDLDMWILAGVVEMLAAHKREPLLVPLDKPRRNEYMDYAAWGIRFMRSRLTESALQDFDGKPVKGWNFDLGAWDAHSDYAYAGYTGESFPTKQDKKAPVQAGWDISHARRLVHVLETLHNNREVTGQSFPTHEDMIRFANQLLYGVFNRDFQKPLFANFMNGANGWYRVDYAGRKDFGYRPYGLSNSFATGGYGLWARYNPDMKRVTAALWDMLRQVAADVPAKVSGRPQGTAGDQEFGEHVRTYYSPAYTKPHCIDLMQFLASRGTDR